MEQTSALLLWAAATDCYKDHSASVCADSDDEAFARPPTGLQLGGPHHTPSAVVQDVVPDNGMKEEMMAEVQKGNFTMRMLREQLQNIQKMGPVSGIMGMIPGFNQPPPVR